MFLSNPAKFFLAYLLFSLTFAGCGTFTTSNTQVLNSLPETEKRFPFSTIEPDEYQADVVITTAGRESRMFLAVKNDLRRADFNIGDADEFSVLHSDKDYLIAKRAKMYSVTPPGSGELSGSNKFSDLIGGIVYGPDADFVETASENGRTVYTARLSGTSEVLLTIDNSTNLPVKQEFYSYRGDDRILQYSVEFRDLKTDTDANAFDLPTGFREASPEVVRKAIEK